MKVLIIGKSGQLARELLATKPHGVQLLCLGRADVNILQPAELAAAVQAFKPQVMLNASGYTQVDKAETEVEQAFAINDTAVANMAQIAAGHGIRFIHVSSDYVFDGRVFDGRVFDDRMSDDQMFDGERTTPYEVTDEPRPLNVYGASKLAGERAVARVFPPETASACIVRSSWAYSQYGDNFVNTMLKLMRQKPTLNVVADQIGGPTYARGLAEFIWRLAVLDRLEPVYHWCDLGQASWYEFALAIQETALELGLLQHATAINPINSNEYLAAAKRPHFSLLDVSGSQKILAGKPWRAQLRLMLARLAAERPQ